LVEQIGELTAKASTLAGGQPVLIKARLEKRLTELAGEAVTEERILQEAAAMAVKADVQEELDRLRGHVDAARSLLATDGGVRRGRARPRCRGGWSPTTPTWCCRSQPPPGGHGRARRRDASTTSRPASRSRR